MYTGFCIRKNIFSDVFFQPTLSSQPLFSPIFSSSLPYLRAQASSPVSVLLLLSPPASRAPPLSPMARACPLAGVRLPPCLWCSPRPAAPSSLSLSSPPTSSLHVVESLRTAVPPAPSPWPASSAWPCPRLLPRVTCRSPFPWPRPALAQFLPMVLGSPPTPRIVYPSLFGHNKNAGRSDLTVELPRQCALSARSALIPITPRSSLCPCCVIGSRLPGLCRVCLGAAPVGRLGVKSPSRPGFWHVSSLAVTSSTASDLPFMMFTKCSTKSSNESYCHRLRRMEIVELARRCRRSPSSSTPCPKP
jgi:hypothetical protein